ncbi:MAG: LysR family transcriptional regulator, partial [Halomonas sp.]|nr:LysR family transcriptional regulator [Halomonas sp.]
MKVNGAWLLPVLIAALLFSGLGMAQEEEDEEREQWFSVDSLNAGLGEVPEEVKRLTPRESIRSFLALADEKNFAAAAHMLNLSELDEAEQ